MPVKPVRPGEKPVQPVTEQLGWEGASGGLCSKLLPQGVAARGGFAGPGRALTLSVGAPLGFKGFWHSQMGIFPAAPCVLAPRPGPRNLAKALAPSSPHPALSSCRQQPDPPAPSLLPAQHTQRPWPRLIRPMLQLPTSSGSSAGLAPVRLHQSGTGEHKPDPVPRHGLAHAEPRGSNAFPHPAGCTLLTQPGAGLALLPGHTAASSSACPQDLQDFFCRGAL